MPKVSQEYRDARRAQILGAAKRCFARNGFHGTSMQDLFAESGLSAGAVYRYFPSKDDMILAIAEENMVDVVGLIHAAATRPEGDGVGETLGAVLDLVREKNEQDALGPIALFVWGEALRNPSIAERFETLLRQMRSNLAAVVTTAQRAGSLSSAVRPDELAALLVSIVPGFILQLALLDDDALAAVPRAARALLPD